MQNFDNLQFVELKIYVNSELNLYDLRFPGVFAVYCVKTNRVFFVSAEDILSEIGSFFEDLVSGTFENKLLLNDFLLYGKESFQFFVLACDLDFENEIKRERALNKLKTLYSGDFY